MNTSKTFYKENKDFILLKHPILSENFEKILSGEVTVHSLNSETLRPVE